MKKSLTWCKLRDKGIPSPCSQRTGKAWQLEEMGKLAWGRCGWSSWFMALAGPCCIQSPNSSCCSPALYSFMTSQINQHSIHSGTWGSVRPFTSNLGKDFLFFILGKPHSQKEDRLRNSELTWSRDLALDSLEWEPTGCFSGFFHSNWKLSRIQWDRIISSTLLIFNSFFLNSWMESKRR